MYQYNFPAINAEIKTLDEKYYQVLKIKEEVHEVQDEIENMRISLKNGGYNMPLVRKNYVMELMDVIQACETSLREFDDGYLAIIKDEVIRKNEIRNYYK